MENNEYYKKISTNECDEMVRNNMVDISVNQINIISNKIKIGEIGLRTERYKDKLFLRLPDDKSYFICALKDDWFLFYNRDSYLCDQFDGLLKCLEDKYTF